MGHCCENFNWVNLVTRFLPLVYFLQSVSHMELRSRKGKSKDEKTAAKVIRQPVAPKQKLLMNPIGIMDLLQFIVVGLVLASIVSWLTTNTMFYNLEINLPNIEGIKNIFLEGYVPQKELRNFTLSELAEYDGSDGKEIYLAVNGKVYNVTSKPTAYGPNGGYKAFAAKDATRAYGTGCFKGDELTHDTRGLTKEQLASVDHWDSFYSMHKEYEFLGHVKLPKPSGPLPTDCADDNKDKNK
eukprot:NODE_655_length_5500_cov_0.608776.p3 type:complete len:241 gc:universal NODE_655_length_5500_cov_0.608776:164-886(+)